MVMKQNAINFAKLLKDYKSGWVAISSDFTSVVLSGKTLKEALTKAQAQGIQDPIMTKMPEMVATYVGNV